MKKTTILRIRRNARDLSEKEIRKTTGFLRMTGQTIQAKQKASKGRGHYSHTLPGYETH